jgi:hypothetical protein
MNVRCQYLDGPLDGQFEVREQSPLHGDMVYRLVADRYVAYRWDAVRIAFVLIQR